MFHKLKNIWKAVGCILAFQHSMYKRIRYESDAQKSNQYKPPGNVDSLKK